jgi:hypothetical protein
MPFQFESCLQKGTQRTIIFHNQYAHCIPPKSSVYKI